MTVRRAAAGLAAVALCAALVGAGGLASVVLLAAIVAGAAWLLGAVGAAAEGQSGRVPVATAAGGLVSLVAAGTAHLPLLVLGVFVCAGLEALGEVGGRADAAGEPAELVEAPLSRAA